MLPVEDRRRDKRIRFSWPLWFGYSEHGELIQAKLIDLSRSGAGFVVGEHQCPGLGQHILTRFSYPSNLNGTFDIDSYFHWAQVVRVDNFGNLITNIGQDDMLSFLESREPVIGIGNIEIKRLSDNYSNVESGDILALINSSGVLEVSVNMGRASEYVGLSKKELIGAEIIVGRCE